VNMIFRPMQVCPIEFAQFKFAQCKFAQYLSLLNASLSNASSPNTSVRSMQVCPIPQFIQWGKVRLSSIGRTCNGRTSCLVNLDWANLHWAKDHIFYWMKKLFWRSYLILNEFFCPSYFENKMLPGNKHHTLVLDLNTRSISWPETKLWDWDWRGKK